MARKNLDDYAGTVDDGYAGGGLEVAQLRADVGDLTFDLLLLPLESFALLTNFVESASLFLEFGILLGRHRCGEPQRAYTQQKGPTQTETHR